ncbi:MAG: glucose-6-phosphate dehydrogenase assembly protein OpcA [Chlamydiae bacterium]|nr:glucose-6-phosphate dehydrogenase assembly protein OpcA [Chlamydiota bacterium]
MNPSQNSQTVSAHEIEGALTRLWESIQGKNKLRASLFNLLFFTEKNLRAKYVLQIAHKIIEKFPSRIIFITKNSDLKEPFLKIDVSILSAGKGEQEILCDFIQIEGSTHVIKKIPFVILPHMLPDLPIYLIWAEDPCKNEPLFQELKKFANRFIFDSETADKLSDFAKRLLSIVETAEIADLNWARMKNWRDLLSMTFYTEKRLNELKQTKQLQIFYNALPSEFYSHTLIQSIYLQGWIASQMNWKFIKIEQKEGQIRFIYRKHGQKNLTVSLHPEKFQNIPPGSIISVDLTTENENHFSFGRDLNSPHEISMRFSTLEKCEIPLKYLFERAEPGQSLIREISQKGSSIHYVKLLHFFKEMKGLNV